MIMVIRSKQRNGFKTKIDSITHCPEEFHGPIILSVNSSIDFTGIKKVCKKMAGVSITVSNAIGIFELLSVPGFMQITCNNSAMSALDSSKEFQAAVAIINKYAGQGNSGIIKAQREMIEADLDDYVE